MKTDMDLSFLDEQPSQEALTQEEFNKAYDAAQAQAQSVPDRKLIIRSTRIDPYCTLRKRFVLTPTMCTRNGCTFDAAAKWGGYENAPESERPLMAEVLKQHDLNAHNRSEDLVINESELPTQWLGEANARRGLFK